MITYNAVTYKPLSYIAAVTIIMYSMLIISCDNQFLFYNCDDKPFYDDSTQQPPATNGIRDGVNWSTETSLFFYIPKGGTAKLRAIAARETAGEANKVEQARQLWKYVMEVMSYDKEQEKREGDSQLNPIANPIDSLNTGRGICNDYGILYYCLAVCSGLPVSCVRTNAHLWNEVYISPTQYLFIDATWGDKNRTDDMYFKETTSRNVIPDGWKIDGYDHYSDETKNQVRVLYQYNPEN